MSVYKLKELGTFKNGANYPKGSYGKGLPIINVKDLFTPRYVNFKELAELKQGALRNEDEYLVEEDDILFSRSSLVQSGAGMCAIAHNVYTKILFCGFIIRYRISRRDIVNPLYLLYLLRTPAYRRLFTGTQQTNIANINQDSLGNIEVDLPNLAVQEDIVSLIKAIDDKRDNNDVICSDLESMAKLLYDYWFVQFDFPDENGRPYKSSGGKMVWNEELKREIPEGWEVKPLVDVFDVTMGSSPKGDSLNEIGNGIEFYQGSTDFGYLYPSMRVFTTAPVRYAKAQDILISVRAPVGDMNIAMNDCCIGRGLAAIHHKSTIFAWCMLQTFKPFFDIYNGSGTTFGALTSDDLKGQLTIVPKQLVLDDFCKKVEAIGFKLRELSLENQQLASLRDFLLPMLMNGQVKVGKGI